MATTLIVLGHPSNPNGFSDLTGRIQRLSAANGKPIVDCPQCPIQTGGTAIVVTQAGDLEMRPYDKRQQAGSIGISAEVAQVVPMGALVYSFTEAQAARDWYAASQADFGMHVAYFFDDPKAPAA